MFDPVLQARPSGARARLVRTGLHGLGLGLLTLLLVGCAAVTNPVADGIPVRFLPNAALGESKDMLKPIPEAYFRQAQPEVYRLDKGDVLGIWIEGVLGEKGAIPPVHYSVGDKDSGHLPPSIGFPFPIRDDGTIALPLISPLKVAGMSIEEAQAAIVKAYTVTQKILQPGRERIVVSLSQPRRYHVLVLREDAGTATVGSTGGSGGLNAGTFFTETRKSTGTPLDLPAYENDLLNALSRSGGMPGFEAEDEVIIQRGAAKAGQNAGGACPPGQPPAQGPGGDAAKGGNGIQEIRIPLRLPIGEKPQFSPSDIILNDGDIVSVRIRRGEVFYTGGLIPPRMFVLPKNRDLNVVEALIVVGAPILNGGIGVNNLTGNTTQSGIGSPSPSQVTILRRTTCGGQIPIRVSLNRAFRDPRENVRILPGDIIILQESMLETVTRYVTNVWRFDFLGTIVRQKDLIGTSTLNVP